MVELLSVATALPLHCIDSAEAKIHLENYLGAETSSRYCKMVDASRVQRRYTVAPAEELFRLRTLQERNDLYMSHARALGERVARETLTDGSIDASSVSAVISVSCTGYMMPSLDAQLIERLGLPSQARRIPITELGCSAGVGAVGLAAERLTASVGSVLILSVEISSPGIQIAEPSTTDMVANLLFGDAAAATVLSTEKPGTGPQVLASQSTLWLDSLDHLGMRLTDSGLRLVLSPRLPRLVRDRLRPTVTQFLAAQGVALDDVRFWVIHPGGPKILEAVAESLELSDRTTQPTWDVWERYGNLSSATVFFILRRLQEAAPPAPGDLGMMIALGPGITCEMVLLRSAGWLSEHR